MQALLLPHTHTLSHTHTHTLTHTHTHSHTHTHTHTPPSVSTATIQSVPILQRTHLPPSSSINLTQTHRLLCTAEPPTTSCSVHMVKDILHLPSCYMFSTNNKQIEIVALYSRSLNRFVFFADKGPQAWANYQNRSWNIKFYIWKASSHWEELDPFWLCSAYEKCADE